MKKGVVLFAHNNSQTNYYDLAVYTAKRVEQFLQLPVTLITDENSVTGNYTFDNIIKISIENTDNLRNRIHWINKTRYQVFELTPYEDTLIIDVDYLINSNKLLQTFTLESDFVCHYNIKYFFENVLSEKISKNSVDTMWATVMRFKKTNRVAQIFSMIKMIQDNYEHYQQIHGFLKPMYRNDYALTLALRTINGQLIRPEDNIPWSLLHVNNQTQVERIDETSYAIIKKKETKNNYIVIKNLDFHMMNKDNFTRLIQ